MNVPSFYPSIPSLHVPYASTDRECHFIYFNPDIYNVMALFPVPHGLQALLLRVSRPLMIPIRFFFFRLSAFADINDLSSISIFTARSSFWVPFFFLFFFFSLFLSRVRYLVRHHETDDYDFFHPGWQAWRFFFFCLSNFYLYFYVLYFYTCGFRSRVLPLDLCVHSICEISAWVAGPSCS